MMQKSDTNLHFDPFWGRFQHKRWPGKQCYLRLLLDSMDKHKWRLETRRVRQSNVKWVHFKRVLCCLKVLARPFLHHLLSSLLRIFKWGTVWSFISRGIRNIRCQTFCFPNLHNELGLFLIKRLVILEIRLYQVSHQLR